MFSAIRNLFARANDISVENDSVRFQMSTPGWRRFHRDTQDRIESFKRGRQVLNVNVRRYRRSDGQVATDALVREGIVTLSREKPTEIFQSGAQWIGHYRSGPADAPVDHWHMAVLSSQGEMLVATVIVLFTDDGLRAELRSALAAASLTRL